MKAFARKHKISTSLVATLLSLIMIAGFVWLATYHIEILLLGVAILGLFVVAVGVFYNVYQNLE